MSNTLTIDQLRRQILNRQAGILPSPTRKTMMYKMSTKMREETLDQVHSIQTSLFDKSLDDTMFEIPFFANFINDVNVFRHDRRAKQSSLETNLKEILIGIHNGFLHMEMSKGLRNFTIDHFLFKFVYPINYSESTSHSNLCFNLSVSVCEDFIELIVTDPILYHLVKLYSKCANMSTITRALYLPGPDLDYEIERIELSYLDQCLMSIGQTVLITTIVGKHTDQLGLASLPGYAFAFGSYDHPSQSIYGLKRYLNNDYAIYALPLWNHIYPVSFSYELTTTEIKYSYFSSYLFNTYPELYQVNLPQCNNDLQNLNYATTEVVLDVDIEDVTPYGTYLSNINIRNAISTKLDRIDRKHFCKVKDAMFPKILGGAVNKLRGILDTYNLKYDNVMDIGAAPGTWTEYFLEQGVESLIAITSTSSTSLKMYPNVIKKIHAHPKATLVYGDIEDQHFINKYDLIASDAANQKVDYIRQSEQHEELALQILNLYTNLSEGGSLICKIFDLSPRLYSTLLKMSPYFKKIDINKPKGSCVTNSEMYIICLNYTSSPINQEPSFLTSAQNYLYQQIIYLNYLVSTGFNIDSTYSLTFNRSRLRLNDVTQLPPNLAVSLNRLHFCHSLFPKGISGTLSLARTNNNDDYALIQWNIPKILMPNSLYVKETRIGYASNNLDLSNLVITHHGVVSQDSIIREFIIFNKFSSCLIAAENDEVIVTTVPIYCTDIKQITFSELLKQPNTVAIFGDISNFQVFIERTRFLMLNRVIDVANYVGKFGLTAILTTFFREAETMCLSYFETKTGYLASRIGKENCTKKLDLNHISDCKKIMEEYKISKTSNVSIRSFFLHLFNQYSIIIPKSEFLQREKCSINEVYKEYKTNQICISRPACHQLRRFIKLSNC